MCSVLEVLHKTAALSRGENQIPNVHSAVNVVFIVQAMACKERKCGGTSASRDENGQVDVWH